MWGDRTILRSQLVSLCWTWVLLSVCQGRRAADDKPNIILIMADDLGIGDLGCYGNNTIRTPNIDRLASEGVKLKQHIAAASLCTPSRSAFLTGRYAIRSVVEDVASLADVDIIIALFPGMASETDHRVLRVLSVPGGLPVKETTFAALAKKQGYSTALIGKWHQGLNSRYRGDHAHHPHKYGFDYYYGMPYTLSEPCWPDPSRDAELAISHKVWICVQLIAITALTLAVGKLSRRICISWFVILFLVLLIVMLGYFWLSSYTSRLYWDCILMREEDITEQPMKAERAGSIMVKEVVSFIERHRDIPFLLFYSFLHVHVPLPTMDTFIGISQHGLYGDNVEEMDFFVGKLLSAIDNFGLRNNTLIYFTSDHGGHLEARLGHAQLGGWNGIYKGGKGMGGWEGGIRVPGLLRWPGVLPAGYETEELTSLMDILPTIAAATGGDVPQDRVIDGRNLLPLLQGSVQHSEHEFLFHYCGSFLHAARWDPKDSQAVWKVHYVTPVFQPPGAIGCFETQYCQCSGELVTYHDPPLLFDLSRDPSESTPLTGDTEPLYDLVIRTVADALEKHKKTITPVEQQLGDLNEERLWLRPCCGVFPFCMCDKEGDGPTPQA